MIILHNEEITVDKVYLESKRYREFSRFFLDYDYICVPPRKYFWDIFSTLKQKLAKKLINHKNKKEANK